MIDREKVIKALTECIFLHEHPDDDAGCLECPYRPDEKGTCPTMIPFLKDVLELLKKQETKLLDADEITSCIIYWMECENVSQVWPIEMHHIRNQHLLNGPEWEDDYGDVWKMPDYNKTWRCWTAKPTDEQRKVVKWDDRT